MDYTTSPALLFTPGNKPERFVKALTAGANGLILDLEDAVPAEEKNHARDNVLQFLAQKNTGIITIVRINHLSTEAGLLDLLAIKRAEIHCNAILSPKTESAAELEIIYEVLNLKNKDMKLFALIETAKGLHNINSIVLEAPVSGVFFGAADLGADMQCDLSWGAMLYARYQIVQAAALAHIPAFDSPFFDFSCDDQLINETMKAKELGFKGKLAIHPKQLVPIQQCFAPNEEQINSAKEIIALFERSGGKACQYNGKMIDIPVYKHAQQVLKLSENKR